MKVNRLFKIELAKITHYPFFWILSGITAFLITIFIFGMAYLKHVEVNTIQIQQQTDINTENLYQTLPFFQIASWIASWFNIFFAVLIMQIVAMEYNFRTLKQHIIDGIKPNDFVTSKLLLTLFLAISFAIFVIIVTLIAILLFLPNQPNGIFYGLQFISAYFFQMLYIMIFAMFLSIATHNIAAAISLYIGWGIFEKIMNFSLNSMGYSNIASALPLNNISKIVQSPNILFNGYSEPIDTIITPEFWIASAYAIAFIFICYFLVKKRPI